MSDEYAQRDARDYLALMYRGISFRNSPQDLGANNAGVIKASPGIVHKIYCHNLNSSLRYFQIFNKKVAPVNTNIPIESYPVPANGAILLESSFWGSQGINLDTGIAWAFSTTPFELTLGSASDQISQVGYE